MRAIMFNICGRTILTMMVAIETLHALYGAVSATCTYALGRQNSSEMMTIGGGVGSFDRRRVMEVTILRGGGDKREDEQDE